MNDELSLAQENFIQGMSRISNFWGFPRAMGALFGAIYLSPEPLSLDELVERADRALYLAKGGGRDRVASELALEAPIPITG